MIQQTSLKAYAELHEWIVNKTYTAILSTLSNNPNGLTDREIASILGYSDPNKVRPRRKELEDKELIYSDFKRVCQVSGKTAIIWKIKKNYESEKYGI